MARLALLPVSLLLAARHPADIQGLLAFSPGEYLGTPGAARKAEQNWAAVPVFLAKFSK